MAAFQPGGFSAPATYNFISAADIVAKSYLSDQVPIYGSQLMTMLIEQMGNRREVENIRTSHWEDVKIMPKVTVTTAGAGAGLQAIYTLTATTPAQIFSETQNSPYVATSPAAYNAGIPVKVGDHLILKAGSAPVNATTNIQVRVDSVNKTTGTFTATPLSLASATPAMASATEIFIAGNSHGEGSDMPDAFSVLPTEKFFNLQIFKHKFKATGTEKSIKCYVGNTSYYVRGEQDAAKVFSNKIELGLMTGQLYDNPAITDPQQPISLTKGLLPSIIEDGGFVQGYSTLTGYGIPEYEDLIFNLDKEMAPKKMMHQTGINLSFQIDRSMADFYKQGAIQYAAFGNAAAQAAHLNFNEITRGNYQIFKSTYDPFNNTQMFGADGYSFPQEGFTVPMEGGNDAKTGDYMNSVGVLYLKDRDKEVVPFDGIRQGDQGQDVFEVRYQGHRGLETFGVKNFSYQKVQ